MRRGAVVASAVAFLGASVAACGDGEGRGEEATVTVLAAASLTDVFTEAAAAFEDEHPGVVVELNFAASSSLREQVLAGAPADVFASADEANVEWLVEAGEATAPVPFARNGLAIAVPAGNPAGVTGLADFARGELLLGLCAPEVPCGALARRALDGAGVVPAVDTEEPDVRALLTKVEAGELDAGIVYRTDVLAADARVDGVALPADQDVVTTYPVTVLRGADDPGPAGDFVAFLRSADGQELLAAHGFQRAEGEP